MKITKYGHCCLLIEENGTKLLTDPGSFTAQTHASLTGIDLILYTHEHADHYHLDSLKQLLAGNPGAQIIANEGTSALLEKEGIAHTKMLDGESEHNGVAIRGVSGMHEVIHATIPRIQNTGFMIASRLWYPGDAFIDPKQQFEILALPVAGPWMKLSEAIDYAIALKPKVAFPVHDMILNPAFTGFVPMMVGGIIGGHGIEMKAADIGSTNEF